MASAPSSIGSEGNSASTSVRSEGNSVSTPVSPGRSSVSTSAKPQESSVLKSANLDANSIITSVEPEGSSLSGPANPAGNSVSTSINPEISFPTSLSESNVSPDQINPGTSQIVSPNQSSSAVTSPIRHQANPTSFAYSSHLEISTPGDTEANQAEVTFQTLVSTISQAGEGQLATIVGNQLGSGQVPKTARRRSTLAAVAGRASSSPSLHPQYENGGVRLVCWNLVYTILSALLFM